MSAEQPYQRGFMFWALAPFLTVFILTMPFLIQKHDATALALLAAMEVFAILMLLGLYDPHRLGWAWRGVGLSVFLVYAWYLVVMLVQHGGRMAIPARKAEASPFNALCGLIVFGLPGLYFALTGRLTWKRNLDEAEEIMLGSVIIHEPDRSKLDKLADEWDALDDFNHVSLQTLTTIDFESICSSAGVSWSHREPVAFDEETGLAILAVTPEGLDCVLRKEEALESEQQADAALLRTFVAQHGKEHLYELVTF